MKSLLITCSKSAKVTSKQYLGAILISLFFRVLGQFPPWKIAPGKLPVDNYPLDDFPLDNYPPDDCIPEKLSPHHKISPENNCPQSSKFPLKGTASELRKTMHYCN